MNQRTPISERLDKLYVKSIRCPYCNTKIPKCVDKCENCGITKAQIINAEIKKEKNKDKPVKLYSKVRPDSIPFWKMALGGMFGFLGVHAFISKRNFRAWFILSCTIAFFVFGIIFNPQYEDAYGKIIEAHWLRTMFESKGWPFPFDVLAIVAGVMWIWDWFAILFGHYKYPVIIKENLTK